MSKLNDLRFGNPDSVREILDDEECEEHELRAVLMNAMERIASLERQVEHLREAR